MDKKPQETYINRETEKHDIEQKKKGNAKKKGNHRLKEEASQGHGHDQPIQDRG